MIRGRHDGGRHAPRDPGAPPAGRGTSRGPRRRATWRGRRRRPTRPRSARTFVMAARRPASSCHATSTHQPTSSARRGGHARVDGRLGVEQGGVASQGRRRRAQDVGARRALEPLERAGRAKDQVGRLGLAPLGQGSGPAPRQAVVRQRRLHEVVERRAVAASPIARGPRCEARSGGTARGPGPAVSRWAASCEDPLLGEGAGLVGGRPQQVADRGSRRGRDPRRPARDRAGAGSRLAVRSMSGSSSSASTRNAARSRRSTLTSARTSIESGSSSSSRRSRRIVCSPCAPEPSREKVSPARRWKARASSGSAASSTPVVSRNRHERSFPRSITSRNVEVSRAFHVLVGGTASVSQSRRSGAGRRRAR